MESFLKEALKVSINDFIENTDYFLLHKFVKQKGSGGHNAKEYALIINMAKELAMVENNEKGKQARRYFIEAEKLLTELRQNKRLEAFTKLVATKEKFKNNVTGLGGNENDYIQIDYEARKVLFNSEPLEDDVLNIVLLKGRDFAIEMTNGGIIKGEITDLNQVEKLAKESHNDVREAIIKNMNIKPEEIPTEGDIKKLEE